MTQECEKFKFKIKSNFEWKKRKKPKGKKGKKGPNRKGVKLRLSTLIDF